MIGVLVATEVENLTRCGICRRSLLLGESAAVFQDDRTRAIHTVCALCTQRAERAGWTTVGEPVSRPRLRVHTNNPAVDQDRLVQRLQADLERMQRELAGANGLLTSARSDTAAELARGSALEQAVKERDEHIAALEHEIANRDVRLDELEAQLREALEEHEALRKARRREADAAYLGGIAAEVFNRSPHRQEIANLVARMGEPTVRIAAEGITLPRPVRVIFGWQQGWRSYRVTCDLVARLFDVEPVAGALNGKLEPPIGPLRGNAHLVDGRLVAGGVRS